MLKHKALAEFAAWRTEQGSRAMLVVGAHQVGKTYRQFRRAETTMPAPLPVRAWSQRVTSWL